MLSSRDGEVAVVAPSSGLAAVFPHMRDRGAQRLGELLDMSVRLTESCYLTSDQLTPERRARDLNAVFADPKVKCVVATIGGDDAVRVLPLLDVDTIAKNPKPFLGYSDATSLHLLLYQLGIVSLYGGALLCQFALSGPDMHAYTQESILGALFAPLDKPLAVRPSEAFLDGYLEWGDPANMPIAKPLEDNPGWEWHHCDDRAVRSGLLWGGCLEVVYKHLATQTCVPDAYELNGAVLFVETSESFPPAAIVYDFFQTLGQLGLLCRFSAVLVGRPQTVCRGQHAAPSRDSYRYEQKLAVLRAIREYTDPPVAVIFDLDFGHTDPQILVPVGGLAHIYPHSRTLTFTYDKAPRPRPPASRPS